MRNRILVGILCLALMVAFILPTAALAGTTDTITITATGSEINIAVDTAAWDVGFVQTSATAETGIAASWATLTNSGAEAVDVTIAGRSMKDAADTDTWTLDDTGAPGSDIFGMKAGLDDADDLYDIVIKNVGASPNLLVDELAGSGTQDFGLKFYAPTSMSTYEEMEMVGTVGTHTDADRGILFTGSID